MTISTHNEQWMENLQPILKYLQHSPRVYINNVLHWKQKYKTSNPQPMMSIVTSQIIPQVLMLKKKDLIVNLE